MGILKIEVFLVVTIVILSYVYAFDDYDNINNGNATVYTSEHINFHQVHHHNDLVTRVNKYVAALKAKFAGNIHTYKNNCKRPCKDQDSRICYFNFYLEHYQAMGIACGNCRGGNTSDCFNNQCVMASGVERGVKSVNRMIPGPHMEVCVEDVIVVDVINNMPGNEVAIHWHGILQAGTQYMDGIPFVTQCPIHFNNEFRYTFIADYTGTYFWHAHSGHQKADGQHGALTIRGPLKDEPNRRLYDVDDTHIFIADWQNEMATMFDPGLPTRQPGTNPDTFLINGRGKYTFPATGIRTATPYALFHFRTGKSYRTRFVNSASHVCPVQVQIQDHNMTVISTDGSSVKPRVINSFVIYAGERYDFVIHATKTSGMYWIHFKGLGPCSLTHTYQLAMIAYNQDPALKWMDPTEPEPTYDAYEDGKILNHPNISDTSEHIIKIEKLEAYDIDKRVLSDKRADERIVIAFSNRLVTYSEVFNSEDWFRFMNLFGTTTVVGTMDGIQSSFPPSPYLSQPTDGSNFCTEENLPKTCRNDTFCVCNHVRKIKKGKIVELMLVDESTGISLVNHPIHLHGFKVYVTEMGQGFRNGTRVTKHRLRELESDGSKFTKDVFSAPLKDTVSVPSFGYVVVKFKADNPGYWAMHCHFDVHLLVGMIMTFQVGENRDIPHRPHNFPQCGNYA